MATATKKAPAAKKTSTSTAVAVKKTSSTSMVSIQDAIRAQAALMAERTDPATGSVIRAQKDKTLKLPDGTVVTELDVIILDFIATQDYYPEKFDQKNPMPPVCFAIGTNPKKLVPSDNSPDKQCKDCNSCDWFQWGSDGNGKACKSGRKLAVLPIGADADTPIWIIKVSPTGVKAFDSFIQNLARMEMIPIGVSVTVSCDPAAEYQSLRFTDPQPNKELALYFDRQAEGSALCAAEPDVSKRLQEAPAKAKPAARGARK